MPLQDLRRSCNYALRNLDFRPSLPDASILTKNVHSVKNQRKSLASYLMETSEGVVGTEAHWLLMPSCTHYPILIRFLHHCTGSPLLAAPKISALGNRQPTPFGLQVAENVGPENIFS